jgi:hypothetical protein
MGYLLRFNSLVLELYRLHPLGSGFVLQNDAPILWLVTHFANEPYILTLRGLRAFSRFEWGGSVSPAQNEEKK